MRKNEEKERQWSSYIRKKYKKVLAAEKPFNVDPDTNMDENFVIFVFKKRQCPKGFDVTKGKVQREYYPLSDWYDRDGRENKREWHGVDTGGKEFCKVLLNATKADWDFLQECYQNSKDHTGDKKMQPFYCEIPDVRGKCSLWDAVSYEKRNNIKLDRMIYYEPDDFVFYAYPTNLVLLPEEKEFKDDSPIVKELPYYERIERGSVDLLDPTYQSCLITLIFGFAGGWQKCCHMTGSIIIDLILFVIGFFVGLICGCVAFVISIVMRIVNLITHPVVFNTIHFSSVTGLWLPFRSFAYIYDDEDLRFNLKLREEAKAVGIYDVNDPICKKRNFYTKGLIRAKGKINRLRARYLKYVPGILRIALKLYILGLIINAIYGYYHPGMELYFDYRGYFNFLTSNLPF